MSEEKAEAKGSDAFEAIKPELIAFLKANLSVSVNSGGYDSTSIEVYVHLCGEEISYGSAGI